MPDPMSCCEWSTGETARTSACSSASICSSITAPLLGSLPCFRAVRTMAPTRQCCWPQTHVVKKTRAPNDVGVSPSLGRSGLSSLPALRLFSVLSEAAPSLLAIDRWSLESCALWDPAWPSSYRVGWGASAGLRWSPSLVCRIAPPGSSQGSSQDRWAAPASASDERLTDRGRRHFRWFEGCLLLLRGLPRLVGVVVCR